MVAKLGELVDWDKYEELNPMECLLWCKVTHIGKEKVIVKWFDDEDLPKQLCVDEHLVKFINKWFKGSGRVYSDAHVEWVEVPKESPNPNRMTLIERLLFIDPSLKISRLCPK